jgi:hypothetical protein
MDAIYFLVQMTFHINLERKGKIPCCVVLYSILRSGKGFS